MVDPVVLSGRGVVLVVVRVDILGVHLLYLLLVNGRVVVLASFVVGFDIVLVEERTLGDVMGGEELLRLVLGGQQGLLM